MLEESIHLMGAAEICIFSPQGKFFVSNLFRSFIYIDSLVFLEETSYIVCRCIEYPTIFYIVYASLIRLDQFFRCADCQTGLVYLKLAKL